MSMKIKGVAEERWPVASGEWRAGKAARDDDEWPETESAGWGRGAGVRGPNAEGRVEGG